MNRIVALTPADADNGFACCGAVQQAVAPGQAAEALEHALEMAGSGVVILDERLVEEVGEDLLYSLEQRWPGVLVVLPAPGMGGGGEDYAMRLIRMLASSGMQILVGYSSSDMLLWRHAGAADCASGKFFNLRRFLKSRFEEPAGGGGQLPYWFEETLVAFLRESDLIRIQKASLLSDSSTRNPYCSEILASQAAMPGSTWLAEAWRQYLW